MPAVPITSLQEQEFVHVFTKKPKDLTVSLYPTYCQMIKNAVGSRIFQHLFIHRGEELYDVLSGLNDDILIILVE